MKNQTNSNSSTSSILWNREGRKRKRRHCRFRGVVMLVAMSYLCLMVIMCPVATEAISWQSLWESDDLVSSSSSSGNSGNVETLSMGDISEMRVRDIKRRLSRQHGYGSDELSKILDKRELIQSLSYEEHKVEQQKIERKKRIRWKRSIIVALICVLVVILRPLLSHAWEVLSVNCVVYTDKKRYEFTKCVMEYQSYKGCFGIFLMMAIDLLKLWLTISVLASWILSSSSNYRTYLFPMPSLPIRPAQMLAAASGNAGKAGPLGDYGINVGPMVVTWALRFLHGKIESWMGRVLVKAHKRQRKEVRRAAKKKEKQQEKMVAEEEKKARKAGRKARRAARAAEAEQQQNQQDTKEDDNHPPHNDDDNNTTTTTNTQPANGTTIPMTTKTFAAATDQPPPYSETSGMDELD